MKYLIVFHDPDLEKNPMLEADTMEDALSIASNKEPIYRFARILQEQEPKQVFQFHQQQQMKLVQEIDRAS